MCTDNILNNTQATIQAIFNVDDPTDFLDLMQSTLNTPEAVKYIGLLLAGPLGYDLIGSGCSAATFFTGEKVLKIFLGTGEQSHNVKQFTSNLKTLDIPDEVSEYLPNFEYLDDYYCIMPDYGVTAYKAIQNGYITINQFKHAVESVSNFLVDNSFVFCDIDEEENWCCTADGHLTLIDLGMITKVPIDRLVHFNLGDV